MDNLFSFINEGVDKLWITAYCHRNGNAVWLRSKNIKKLHDCIHKGNY